jgi:hypothetical protein
VKHFRNIGALELTPLRNAVQRHAEGFKDQTWRQDYPGSAHLDSETIYLRMPPVITVESIFNSLEVTDLPPMRDYAFQCALSVVSMMARVHCPRHAGQPQGRRQGHAPHRPGRLCRGDRALSPADRHQPRRVG